MKTIAVILEASLRNITVVFPGCSLLVGRRFGVYCKTTGLEVDPMGIHGYSFHVVACDLSVSCTGAAAWCFPWKHGDLDVLQFKYNTFVSDLAEFCQDCHQ